MNTLHAGIVVIGVSLLVGCGTTGSMQNSPAQAGSAPSEQAASGATPQPIATANDTSDAAGLGQIVYSGRDVIDCGRTRRTGSRIPRDVCRPTSFNGLFPSGGINMGTARESQPAYGNR